jgi:hypothetical protein
MASLDLFLLCRDHFLRPLLSFPRHLNCALHCIMPGIMTPRAGGLDSHDPWQANSLGFGTGPQCHGVALDLVAIGTGARGPPQLSTSRAAIPEKTSWQLQTRKLREQVLSGTKEAKFPSCTLSIGTMTTTEPLKYSLSSTCPDSQSHPTDLGGVPSLQCHTHPLPSIQGQPEPEFTSMSLVLPWAGSILPLRGWEQLGGGWRGIWDLLEERAWDLAQVTLWEIFWGDGKRSWGPSLPPVSEQIWGWGGIGCELLWVTFLDTGILLGSDQGRLTFLIVCNLFWKS